MILKDTLDKCRDDSDEACDEHPDRAPGLKPHVGANVGPQS